MVARDHHSGGLQSNGRSRLLILAQRVIGSDIPGKWMPEMHFNSSEWAMSAISLTAEVSDVSNPAVSDTTRVVTQGFAVRFEDHTAAVCLYSSSCAHRRSTSDHSECRSNCAFAKGQSGMIVLPELRASSTAR